MGKKDSQLTNAGALSDTDFWGIVQGSSSLKLTLLALRTWLATHFMGASTDVYAKAQNFNAQTGTTYTLVIGDAGKLITMNNAAANTLTVPPNSSVAFPVGTRIDVVQIGAGQTTIAQGAGVTVNGVPGLKIRTQHVGATLVKRATDTWMLLGDLSA